MTDHGTPEPPQPEIRRILFGTRIWRALNIVFVPPRMADMLLEAFNTQQRERADALNENARLKNLLDTHNTDVGNAQTVALRWRSVVETFAAVGDSQRPAAWFVRSAEAALDGDPTPIDDAAATTRDELRGQIAELETHNQVLEATAGANAGTAAEWMREVWASCPVLGALLSDPARDAVTVAVLAERTGATVEATLDVLQSLAKVGLVHRERFGARDKWKAGVPAPPEPTELHAGDVITNGAVNGTGRDVNGAPVWPALHVLPAVEARQ